MITSNPTLVLCAIAALIVLGLIVAVIRELRRAR